MNVQVITVAIACSAVVVGEAVAHEPEWISIPMSASATDQDAPELDTDDEDPASNETEDGGGQTKVLQHLFVGVGLGLSTDFGRDYAEDFKVTTLEDGSLFVQEQNPTDSRIRFALETHYLAENVSVLPTSETIDGSGGIEKYGKILLHGAAAVALCGPFAFVPPGDENRRGCGPFVAVIAESDVSVDEFGGGWMIGFGKNENMAGQRDAGFTLGLGVLVDPDARSLSSKVVDPETMIVRDQFRSVVANNQISVYEQETSVSFLVIVTKDF